jgi:hypothetical protein
MIRPALIRNGLRAQSAMNTTRHSMIMMEYTMSKSSTHNLDHRGTQLYAFVQMLSVYTIGYPIITMAILDLKSEWSCRQSLVEHIPLYVLNIEILNNMVMEKFFIWLGT